MNKSLLLTLGVTTLLLPLASCGESAPKISLFDATSRFVIQSFDDKGSIALPTYRNSKTGEVPYSELSQFFYANGGFSGYRTNVVKEGNVYRVKTAQGGKTLLTVDPAKDTFTVENFELWPGNQASINNDIGPDVGSSDPTEEAAVHPSTSSKIIGEKKAEVYELSKYNFDCLESEDKCYVPTQLLSSMFYRWNATDLLYNGLDFYYSTAVLQGSINVINQSYYANKDRFSALAGIDATRVDPIGEEAYRFVYPFSNTVYHIVSLTKDGKGKLLEGASATDKGTEAKIEGLTYSYTWQKKDEGLYVDVFVSGIDPTTGQPATAPRGTQKIPFRETFYGTKKRSKAIADFGYDLLRFQFDHFYGINDVAGYTDFDTYVIGKGLKERLHSEDSATYDEALAELTMKDIDDGHTRYVLPSVQTGSFLSAGAALASKYSGPRYKGLLEKRLEYLNLRKKVAGMDEKGNPSDLQGLFFQGQTAVIRFDDFTAPGSFVSNSLDEKEVETSDPLKCIKDANLPVALDASFYRIKQNNAIKNVVFDLTCNGGGAVSAIPYILGHMSKDPKIYVRDKGMGIVKEFHYQVDLNHDKKYGTPEDTYEGKYNFFVLTSDFSFSCATFLPTWAKVNGAKVIGMKSGGGACTVGAFSDGCGSMFNVSSPQVAVIPSGTGFSHFDGGVTVDHELAKESWYDLAKLDAFVSGLSK